MPVQRDLKLIVSVGQTPPHVWQKAQSAVRVLKSASTASNGQ